MSSTEKTANVAIVGAGLVGALNAIYFAKRGWKVDLFELRKDMRLPEVKANQRGKSINLALSERGLSALRNSGLDLDQLILEAAVPLRARMVHIGKEGRQMSQAYGKKDQHINAVDRARLNEELLDIADKLDNITIYFEHNLLQTNMDKGELIFTVGSEKKTYQSDLIVGADGAYSRTRAQLMRRIRMDYAQEYIDTAYCELTMPPIKNAGGEDDFALDPNHLHIWPRHTFMLIALPNPDKTFTCTLFMPFSMFENIDSDSKVMDFFREHFNDSIPLIGEKRLLQEYSSNPRGALISIKCKPYHYKDKAMIIGDAAHAMVPFYGQGMNCGFQDIQVLHETLDKHNVGAELSADGKVSGLQKALDEYSIERSKDAHAICDLAMYNHYEMQSAVTSPLYLARKRLEGTLHHYFPKTVIPLYTMVSFTTIRYSEAIRRWNHQTWWLNAAAATSVSVVAATAVGLGLRYYEPMIKSISKYACRT
ncbi:hypothetical protein INT43_000122 [Umbelopsis isabellina]|uniref:Kynurenine 3-monooxygenase n=1 Tax=Mortierella isabellina TaxID=91625 RepID=A0A8H7U864_MORIS|nr:hypothetical protein INT43_000122 [Umbelopsis isabellina]